MTSPGVVKSGLKRYVPSIMEVVAFDVARHLVLNEGIERRAIAHRPLHLAVVACNQCHIAVRDRTMSGDQRRPIMGACSWRDFAQGLRSGDRLSSIAR